jgi:hypothetical protein
MKSAIFSARRVWLWFAVRSVEIHIDGIGVAMEHVRCPMTLGRMEITRHIARGELARLRAEYNATFPPGVRRVWGSA